MQLHVEQLKDRAGVIPETVSSVPHPPQGWAVATWEMALLGRGGTLFPVDPEEAPHLEAAKDSSLPWLFDAKENSIRQLAADRELCYQSFSPQRERRKNDVTSDYYRY